MANLLHVTPRTLHKWLACEHDIPHAAFKLLRVLLRYELPHPDWAGWHFQAGKLYSPEGHSFSPHDSAWWSMLVRRAEMFSVVYSQLSELRQAGRTAPGPGSTRSRASQAPAKSGPTDAVGRPAQPAGLDLSIGHIWSTENFRAVSTEGKRAAATPALIWSASTNFGPLSPPLAWVTPERGKPGGPAHPSTRASATRHEPAYAPRIAPAGFGLAHPTDAGVTPR